ncbi:S9 family peptidase [Pedobacter sp. SYSU D00535]|uniref:alpha/beta hydrolase family protein n=1 Tax=Pedobacter sp. SYSU D00535 TaxID=2810308 RepID=UPI001A964930|nr:lipase family protein [Pedobacter sp. SYSU D00535]
MKLKSLSFLLLIITVTSACRKDRPDLQEETPVLISATPAGSYTRTQLQTFATVAGFGNFSAAIQYDVDFFRIAYRTTYKGSEVQASGLLAIPKGTPKAPSLLSAQHGTMFLDADAPSNFPLTFSGFELFATAGFITAIPDYLGYGVSKDIVHPYYDAEHSASTVIDMLKAVKDYLEKENIQYSSRLFLAGYSEGGYVTMAAQQEIETNSSHNLTLSGVAAGAGGYDVTGMLSSIASRANYSEPSFLALLLQSYNTTYNWNHPLTQFFQEPYASRIPDLLNGARSREQINSQLSTATAQLFNPTFYAALSNSAGETVLKQAIAANSFPNWVPKTPTRLYHGTADEAVFFQTSQSTFNRFSAAGATNVQLISIPGGTHQSSIQPMMLDALIWIRSLDQ